MRMMEGARQQFHQRDVEKEAHCNPDPQGAVERVQIGLTSVDARPNRSHARLSSFRTAL